MFTRACAIAIAAVLMSMPAEPAGAEDLKRFVDVEISIIREYFRDHEAPRGHGKGRKALPPGIAKNLARGKPLPPGIARQFLPAGLLEKLPPPPRGYERMIVDGKVLLVEIATRVVHDILSDVLLD